MVVNVVGIAGGNVAAVPVVLAADVDCAYDVEGHPAAHYVFVLKET